MTKPYLLVLFLCIFSTSTAQAVKPEVTGPPEVFTAKLKVQERGILDDLVVCALESKAALVPTLIRSQTI